MFNHSVRKWIPEKLNERELVKQFADAVDWLLSADYPDADKLATRFSSLQNKYKNLDEVPLDDIYLIIEESGYSYITDVLSLDEDSVRTFTSFLSFIHQNKGTRRGLEFVFELLKMDYKITEWFEQSPKGTPMTYNIDLLSFSPTGLRGFEIINKILRFCKNYVYPIMQTLLVQFKVDPTEIGFALVPQSSVGYSFSPDSIYLIWDVGNWDEKLYYFGVDELIYDVSDWDITRWK